MTTVISTAKLDIQPETKACATESVVMSAIGIASGQRVK